jgi:hypothetical protein
MTSLFKTPIRPKKEVVEPVEKPDDEKSLDEIWDEEAKKLADNKREPKTTTIGIRG